MSFTIAFTNRTFTTDFALLTTVPSSTTETVAPANMHFSADSGLANSFGSYLPSMSEHGTNSPFATFVVKKFVTFGWSVLCRDKHIQKFHNNIIPRVFCGHDGFKSLQHRLFSGMWIGTPCTFSVPLVGVLAMAVANYIAIDGRLTLTVSSFGTVPAEEDPL